MKYYVIINHLAILVCFVHYSTSTSPNVLQKFEAIKFDVLPGNVLSVNTSEVTQNTIKVPDKKDCVVSCTDVPWCRSVNAKITPESDGRYLCEVMSTDKYTHKKNLKQDHNYIHFSMKNPCEKKPCPNYTACSVQGNRQMYSCLCKKGFTGKKCEIDLNFCKSSPCINDGTCSNDLVMNRYQCTCKDGFMGTNCQIQYHNESKLFPFNQAESKCKELGSDLPSPIYSAEDNEIVKHLTVTSTYFIWIGLLEPKKDGIFVWRDGTPANYTNWRNDVVLTANHNSENCVLMTKDGTWIRYGCSYPNGVGCFLNWPW